MILVTGASGTNGKLLIERLSMANVAFKAMVRTPGKGPGGNDVEQIVGDFDDAGSLARALEGIDRAFLLTPSTEHAEEQQCRFVAIAKDAGVRHIVKLSQFAADAAWPVRFLRYHAAIRHAGCRSS